MVYTAGAPAENLPRGMGGEYQDDLKAIVEEDSTVKP